VAIYVSHIIAIRSEDAKKIADAFDKKTLKRLQDIHKLDKDTQDKLFFFIDTVIRDAKAKKAYA
jgi:hypothetical protein